ncbi:hypothetical protein HGH92_26425 [Chitinophaga varians]|uniref:Uncharacterized protein n=1 Tax=Chitinophaga varians TaxID=2202339 RepID=A0A847S437_9BACT|nr:hypothetical protein [Chitinophaga varians]NLR67868.1 hypothetical protein [Chitinophaga varians]
MIFSWKKAKRLTDISDGQIAMLLLFNWKWHMDKVTQAEIIDAYKKEGIVITPQEAEEILSLMLLVVDLFITQNFSDEKS